MCPLLKLKLFKLIFPNTIAMSQLIDPRCGQQPYLMEDASVASRCGGYNGVLSGLLVGAIVAVVVLAVPTIRIALGWKIGIAVAAVLVVPLLFWLAGGFIDRRAQQTAQIAIRAREKSGMSRAQAIESIQNLRNSQRSANATFTAGAMVASSLASNAFS